MQDTSPCRCSDADSCPQPPHLTSLHLSSHGVCQPTCFARHQAPLLPLSVQCWPGASTPIPLLCSECVVPDLHDPQLEPWRWRVLIERWLWFLLQTTVIFLVDVDKCMPTAEAWPETWAEQQKWAKAKAAHQAAAVSLHRGDRWPMQCNALPSRVDGGKGSLDAQHRLGCAALGLHSYATSRQVCHATQDRASGVPAAAGLLALRCRQHASSQVQAQAHQQSVCVLKIAMMLQDDAKAKEAKAAEEAKAAAEDKKGDKKDDKKVGLPLSPVMRVTGVNLACCMCCLGWTGASGARPLLR